MNAFTSKTEARSTRKSKAAVPPVEPTKKTIAQKLDELFSDVEEFGITLPSWKRVAVATFTSIALSVGAGYGIGAIASYAVVGIMMLTGSTLLSFMTYMLAVLMSVYVGMKIGQHIGGYILSGQIDRDIVAAKNKIASFFKRSELVSM